MEDFRPVLHVTFNASARGSLTQALQQLGRDDEVRCVADDYAVGPVDGDWVDRTDWHLEIGDDVDYVAWRNTNDEATWSQVVRSDRRVIAWTSTRDTGDLAGFHALLARRHDAIWVVNVADARITRDGQPYFEDDIAVGYLPSDLIVSHALLDRARLVEAREHSWYRARWQELRRENALLRLVRDGRLVSSTLAFADDELFDATQKRWRSCAWVIGSVVGSAALHNDVFLFWRLLDLIERGVLESRGDLQTMRSTQVRRPRRPRRR